MGSFNNDGADVDWSKLLFLAVSKKRKKGPEITEKKRCEDIQECLYEDVDINTVDKNGDTILHKAIEDGYSEVVKFLRENSASIEISNRRGLTALTLAHSLGKTEIFKYLKKSQEDAIDQPQPGGSTASVDNHGVSTSALNVFHNRGDSPASVTRNLKRACVTDDSDDEESAKKQCLASNDLDKGRVRRRTVEQKYVQGGLTRSFHGNMYQLKHYMLILQRASKLGYSFRLAKEMEAADKLDDLVFEYENDNSTEPIHRFLQFKHRAEESAKKGPIGASELLNVDDGDFSLLKYFMSYGKIKKRPEFSGSKLRDYILCTNIDIDVKGLKERNIDVEPVRDRDDFLRVTSSLGDKEPRCCKLKIKQNHELFDILKRASDIHRLAEVLVDHVREPKKLTLTSDILKQYHVSLANEVVHIGQRRFRDNFIDSSQSQNLSTKAKKFREIFLLHLKELPVNKNMAEDDILKKLKQFKFNLSETFGKGEVTELPSDCISDKEISDFFKEFIIAVDQPNEAQLTKIISEEMAAKFNLLNADFTVDYFQTAVINWFKEAGTQGRFLTDVHAEELFDGIRERLSILKTTGVSARYRAELENYDIQFDLENDRLIRFLGSSNSTSSRRLTLTSSKGTLLLALSVHQSLKRIKKYQRDDGCIFIHLEDFLLPNLSEHVLRAFGSSRSHGLLIIDCAANICKLLTHNAWNSLQEITKVNRSKKMILINQTMNINDEEYDDIGFGNLDKDSRRRVLEKKVKFQGEVEISWGMLLGIRDFDNVEAAELEDISEIIDIHTLVDVIKNKPIQIGKEVKGLDENVDLYYINRIILCHGVMEQSSLEAPGLTDLFAVGGDPAETVKYLWTPSDKTSSTELWRKKFINLTDDEEDHFEILCKENPNHNIHWLECESGTLSCKKSTKGIFNLVTYDYDANGADNDYEKPITVWLEEDDLVDNDDQSRVVILADTAGMGKSTVLSKLAQKMKKKEPNLLVIRIDLSSPENTRALDEEKEERTFDEKNIKKAVDFLVDKLVKPDSGSQVFKRLITKGKSRAALLLDGFDEISPTYAETVSDLLQALAKLEIKKLIVTTRPHTSEALEEKLGIRSHTLQPFSKDNQKTLLIKFWKREISSASLDGPIEDRLLEDHAQKVIHLLSNSINDRMKEFTGIPLQTKMVAEVYSVIGGENKKYFAIPSLPERIDIIDLYRNFVEKKYDIYFEEKNRGDKSNLGQKSSDNIGRKLSDAAHQKLALDTLFDKEVVEAFLLSQMKIECNFDLWQQENKDGERTGFITQIIEGKPHFVHRTFSEYFAAVFLFNTLKDDNRNQNLREFFLSEIFIAPQYKTIRAFLNCLLLDGRTATQKESWKSNLRNNCRRFGTTAYHIAAEECRTGILKFLLNSLNAYQSISDSHDQTGLGVTTGSEDFSKPESQQDPQNKEGYSTKIDINIRDQRGRTPLHIAVRNAGDLELVNYILEGGADIDAQDKHSMTPLFEAIMVDNTELAKFLVDKGAELDIQAEHGGTSLHIAAHNDNIELAKFLIHNGASVDIPDDDGRTPLHEASQAGNFELAKFLIDKGADIDTQDEFGRTSLHAALCAGNVKLAKFLLDKGAMINTHDETGCTPLHEASQAGHLEFARTLIDKGANINAKDNQKRAPLHEAAESGNVELVRLLIEQGANIDDQDEDDSTPLHAASKTGNLESARLLIGKGANINTQNDRKRTPLDEASEAGHVDLAKFLLDTRANIDATNNPRRPPLHVAFWCSDVESAKISIEQGNIDTPDEDGCTPLHAVSHAGNIDLAKILVDKGANIDTLNNRRRTPLHVAFKAGNVELVKFLIEKDANINNQDEDSSTPLHEASETGNMELAKLLIDKGANVNIENNHKRTPLHTACWAGNVEVAKFLIEHSNINTQDEDGSTPLHTAADSGDVQLAKFLIDRNANIEIQNNHKQTPLHRASKLGNVELAKFLVEQGASIDTQDEYGSTPLHYAACLDDVVLANFLISRGANIHTQDKGGRTPLHEATEAGNVELAKFLIAKGANINAQEENGGTPLHYATCPDDVEFAKFLIERGADIHNQDEGGRTPLHEASENGNVELAKFLIDKGTKVDTQDIFGKTSLHCVTCHDEVKLAKILIDRGANIEAQNKHRRTPLQEAVHLNNTKMAKFLIEQGANIRAKDKDGRTLLHTASWAGNVELAEFLIAKGVMVDIQDDDGSTPLHAASYADNLELVKFLINTGANIDLQNEDGRTPLHMASEAGNMELVTFFIDKGANLEIRDNRGRKPLHEGL